MQKDRFIIHVDMDAFFAAIEQRDNPKLRGVPVVIGANPKKGTGRGVVSTCSYEARKFGIHSAMPISIAYKKCPHAAFLPGDMNKYCHVSQQIYDIFYEFSPKVEAVSIDEAFLDVTGSFYLFGQPRDVCLAIKSRIREEIGLTASVGIAPTKMAAKIASDLKKPDGLVIVTKEGLLDFLKPLDVCKIWGLGKKSTVVLKDAGIKTIGDLARYDVKNLTKIFGKNGLSLWQLANGIDKRRVQAEAGAKSVSNEFTFERDTANKDKIKGVLLMLSEKVCDRLRREEIKGKTITLKIRLEGFKTYTRSNTLCKATNFADVIFDEITKLYDNFKIRNKKVRLVGVKVSNLTSDGLQLSLFKDNNDEKKEGVHKAIDRIREKFGYRAIYRAGSKI
jgi:nucleotidyltransferase/DNA polymerase involved in DNA repair